MLGLNKKLLELINSAKMQDIKINTQKSVVFLCTNTEQSKKYIKKTIQFMAASKRTKYLGKN